MTVRCDPRMKQDLLVHRWARVWGGQPNLHSCVNTHHDPQRQHQPTRKRSTYQSRPIIATCSTAATPPAAATGAATSCCKASEDVGAAGADGVRRGPGRRQPCPVAPRADERDGCTGAAE